MNKRIQERQKFIRYWKTQTGKTEIDMYAVAGLAKKMGWSMPVPVDPLELLAKQFSEAAREEIREDKQTKRKYKAYHALMKRREDGGQQTFWVDVDEAPRHYMAKALANYRDQMVGEAVIGTNTAEHWNRINPGHEPLNFETDFTEDVLWRRAGTEEKAS